MILFKRCPICDSPELIGYSIDVKRNGPHISRVRCQACDIVFANPMADAGELNAFYQHYYQKGNFDQFGYQDLIIKKKRELEAMSEHELGNEAAFIYKYRTGGRFLDVGAGLGAILMYVDKPEFELFVTELDADAIGFINSNFHQPVNAFQGELPDAGYPDNYFDYVCCNHVIEHVLDPKLYMDEMFRILKPGGILYLGTPNRKSNAYRLYRWVCSVRGKVPSIIDGIEHTFVFSMKNLRDLAIASGFEIVAQRAIPLGDSFGNIFRSQLPLKKKIARYIQTWFKVNQELICRKP